MTHLGLSLYHVKNKIKKYTDIKSIQLYTNCYIDKANQNKYNMVTLQYTGHLISTL